MKYCTVRFNELQVHATTWTDRKHAEGRKYRAKQQLHRGKTHKELHNFTRTEASTYINTH